MRLPTTVLDNASRTLVKLPRFGQSVSLLVSFQSFPAMGFMIAFNVQIKHRGWSNELLEGAQGGLCWVRFWGLARFIQPIKHLVDKSHRRFAFTKFPRRSYQPKLTSSFLSQHKCLPPRPPRRLHTVSCAHTSSRSASGVCSSEAVPTPCTWRTAKTKRPVGPDMREVRQHRGCKYPSERKV